MPDSCRKKAFVLQQNRSFSRSCLQLLSLFQRYFPRRRLFNAGDYGFVWSEYFCIRPVLVDPLVTAQKNLYVRHFVFTFCSVSSKVFSAVCSRDRRCAGPFFATGSVTRHPASRRSWETCLQTEFVKSGIWLAVLSTSSCDTWNHHL